MPIKERVVYHTLKEVVWNSISSENFLKGGGDFSEIKKLKETPAVLNRNKC